MATFGAIIVTGLADHDAFYAATLALGVVRLRDSSKSGALTIDTDKTEFAARLSAIPGVASAFGLGGQSSVDAYVVAEYARGELVRRVVYHRDYGYDFDAGGHGRFAPGPFARLFRRR